jgi:hypothetical protein
MMDRARRFFLLQSSLAAGAILTGSALAEENPLPDGTKPPHLHGKPASTRRATIRSAGSGKWSDVKTWGSRLPGPKDVVLIAGDHEVTYDVEHAAVSGVTIARGGLLTFAADHSATLECSGNFVVEGGLRMIPSGPEQLHALRFCSVNEQTFVGGGMDPVDSDVGLWVMNKGKLDLAGTPKTSWTNSVGSVEQGDSRFEVLDASGWRVGDVVMIVPTHSLGEHSVDWDEATGAAVDSFAEQFERRTISSIEGNVLELSEPLKHHHKAVGNSEGKKWTAEVANLSRNVRIEGTAAGRAHVFVRSDRAQTIRFVEGSHLGPRSMQKGSRRAQLVLGRYALHFHHCYEGSRGSMVEGCAFHDLGNRVYVPHMSHGITMRNNVAFNSMETAFWWDFQESTHDTLWERNLVALVAANGIDSSSMGMSLGQGDGNIARGNVLVYGHHGDPHGHGGYVWDADNEGVWTFEDNLSHSNVTGLFVWQNTSLNHTIVRHESYNDNLAVFHGAYANSYTYTGGHIHGGIVRVKATSGNASGVRFENFTFDGANCVPHCVDIYPSPAASGIDTNVFRQCEFQNAPVGLLMNTFPVSNETTRKHVDLVMCAFTDIKATVDFSKEATLDSWFRIQPASGPCSRIVHATGLEEIKPFAPYHYGTGTGLTGSYFLGPDFDKPVFSRIDSMIMFQQWSYDKGASPHGVHHLIERDEFSVRWTGQVEPQFGEPHTFYVQGGGGFRPWIDGRQVIDSWHESAENTATVESDPVALSAGRRYALRLETFNRGGARGCQLFWNCKGLGRMVHVPQSQLYLDLASALRRS